jgi:predicted negative regulator of RcsB-dependent stress response
MALELMDEHEQGELVRNWLRQNAVAILVGIVAGLGLIIGWQQYQANKRSAAGEAQAGYRTFTEALEKNDAAAAKKAADALRGKFAESPYATFAALRQAKDAVQKGEAKAAVESLEWARTHAPLPALAELATLRLARARLDSGDAKAALALLGEVKDEGYKAAVSELRGDALVALARKDEARKAYDEALTLLDPTSREREFVEMKRDDLPLAAAPAQPAVPVTPAAAPSAAPAVPAAAQAAEEAKS